MEEPTPENTPKPSATNTPATQNFNGLPADFSSEINCLARRSTFLRIEIPFEILGGYSAKQASLTKTASSYVHAILTDLPDFSNFHIKRRRKE